MGSRTGLRANKQKNSCMSGTQASGEHGTLDILADAKPKPVGSLPGSESVLPFAIAEFASPDDVQDKSIFTTEPFSPVVCECRAL